MPDGYSGKFSQRQCKIQLSGDNLGEQKVLESVFFRLSKSLNSKSLATMVPLLWSHLTWWYFFFGFSEIFNTLLTQI